MIPLWFSLQNSVPCCCYHLVFQLSVIPWWSSIAFHPEFVRHCILWSPGVVLSTAQPCVIFLPAFRMGAIHRTSDNAFWRLWIVLSCCNNTPRRGIRLWSCCSKRSLSCMSCRPNLRRCRNLAARPTCNWSRGELYRRNCPTAR